MTTQVFLSEGTGANNEISATWQGVLIKNDIQI